MFPPPPAPPARAFFLVLVVIVVLVLVHIQVVDLRDRFALIAGTVVAVAPAPSSSSSSTAFARFLLNFRLFGFGGFHFVVGRKFLFFVNFFRLFVHHAGFAILAAAPTAPSSSSSATAFARLFFGSGILGFVIFVDGLHLLVDDFDLFGLKQRGAVVLVLCLVDTRRRRGGRSFGAARRFARSRRFGGRWRRGGLQPQVFSQRAPVGVWFVLRGGFSLALRLRAGRSRGRLIHALRFDLGSKLIGEVVPMTCGFVHC